MCRPSGRETLEYRACPLGSTQEVHKRNRLERAERVRREESLRDGEPQESNGSDGRLKSDVASAALRREQSSEVQVSLAGPAGSSEPKDKRAKGPEKGTALRREKNSEGVNPRNA